MNKQIDLSVIKNAVIDIFQNLGDENESFKLFKRILSGCSIYNGSKICRLKNDNDFNEFFMGRIEDIYLLIFEVLKINYPFFQEKIKNMSLLTKKINFSDLLKTDQEPQVQESEKSENLTMKQNSVGHSGGSVLAGFMDN